MSFIDDFTLRIIQCVAVKLIEIALHHSEQLCFFRIFLSGAYIIVFTILVLIVCNKSIHSRFSVLIT